MVKKLLKYEFSALFKTLLPMWIILLSVAFVTRFIQIFENSGKTFGVFMWSSVIMLIIAMIVCVLMTVAVCTVRFYKNFYTAEGYLTLTLPVTHKKHIAAKIIAAFCTSVVSFLSLIAAFMISTAGEVFGECVKAAVYLFKKATEYFKWNTPFYIIECLLVLVVVTVYVYLLFYACITVGQMAKKNRILAAFGAFFGYYIIKQIIGTIIIVCIVVFNNFFEQLTLSMAAHPILSGHIILCGLLVLNSALAVLYFFITERLMKKRLNIE